MKRGRFNLERPLAVNGNADGVPAALHVGNRPQRVGGDRVVQRQRDVAQVRSRPGGRAIVDVIDQRPAPQIRGIAHQVVARGGFKIGRAGQDHLRPAAGGSRADLGNQSDDNAVSEAVITDRNRCARAFIDRANQLGDIDLGRIRDCEGDFLVQPFLEKPGLGGGGIGALVLLNDLRRHHDDHRDGRHDQGGEGNRRDDFDEGKAPLLSCRFPD
ncbi:MAG: hypothetical protein JWM32_995 [Verrucomicrobia bacterium]|nr:hypothetical protein [Verrucomicrobiota bacterium]